MHIGECSESSWPLRPLRFLSARRTQSARRSCTLVSDGLLRSMHIESGECSKSSWPLRPLRFLRARRTQSARRSCTLVSDGLLRSMHIESGECSKSSWPLRPLRFLRARRIQSARRSCTRRCSGIKTSVGQGRLLVLPLLLASYQFVAWTRPGKLRHIRAHRIQSAHRSCTLCCGGLLRSMHIESGECSKSSWPLRPLRFLRARRIQSARRSCARRCSGRKTSVGQGRLLALPLLLASYQFVAWTSPGKLRHIHAHRIQSAHRSCAQTCSGLKTAACLVQ